GAPRLLAGLSWRHHLPAHRGLVRQHHRHRHDRHRGLVKRRYCSVSNSPRIRRVRGSIDEISPCSHSVWAPSPSMPSPSSVGTPSAAVKLPSLPPPVISVCCRSKPMPLATAWACRNSTSIAAVFSNGGRFMPPVTSSFTPGSNGSSPR